MVAHGRTVPEIAEHLGTDSLAYLSLAGVYEAVGGSRDQHCDACFSGEYPLGDADGYSKDKFAFERELPLAITPA
jgi:amidophosphoribosyltransferase